MKRAALLLVIFAGCTSGLDLSQGRNYPCAPDAGSSQCAEGFVCGLEGRCHGLDEAGPFECDSDRYCATSKGWFCDGVSGKCVDASSEELKPALPLSFSRISPALPPAEHLGVSEYFSYGDTTTPDRIDLGLESFVEATFTQHWVLSSEHKVISVVALSSGNKPLTPWIRQDAPEPSGGVTDLAANQLTAFVANPNGVWTRDVRKTPEAWQKLDLPGVVPTRLIRTSSDISGNSDLLWVLGGSSYAYLNLTTGANSGVQTMPDGAKLVELASSHPDYYAPELFFALTDRGLYVTQRDDTNTFLGATGPALQWTKVQLPAFGHLDCSNGTLPGEPMALRVDSDYGNPLRIRIFVRPNGGAPDNPTVIISHGAAPGSITSCGTINLAEIGSGPACPEGQKFQANSYYAYSNTTNTAWCTSAGGTHAQNVNFLNGIALYSAETDAVCNGPLDLPITPAPVIGTNAWADPSGRLWYGWGANYSATVFPKTAFHNVAGGGPVPLFAEARLTACTSNGDFPTNYAYVEKPGVGLTAVDLLEGDFGVCGSLENAPGLVIYDRPDFTYDETAQVWNFAYPKPPVLQVTTVDDLLSPYLDGFGDYFQYANSQRPYGQLQGTEGIPSNPCGPSSSLHVTGTTFRAADGGTQVVVAAGDSFYVGPLARQPDGGASPLVARHVLSPRLNVDQVVSVLPNSERGEVAAGYALAGQRVFRYSAQNPIRWTSNEMELPAGEPMTLWKADANARIGFKDGRVLSLPSRIAISDPLPTPVDAYGSSCGTGYALSDGTLYRLEGREGTTVGEWKPVTIDWGLPSTVPTPTLKQAMLHSVPGALYVLSDQGTVAKITGDCP